MSESLTDAVRETAQWYVGTCCERASGKGEQRRFKTESDAQKALTKGLRLRKCKNFEGQYHVSPPRKKGDHKSKYNTDEPIYRHNRPKTHRCCNSPRTKYYVKKIYESREEAREVGGPMMKAVKCRNNPGKFHLSGRR